MNNQNRLTTVGQIFTPSTPINKKNLFAGREKQIQQVLNAVIQAGQHAVLYGERGVGKTSLASVLQEFLPQSKGLITVRINCDADTTFHGLFEDILSEIKLVSITPGLGFNAEDVTRVDSLRDSIGNNINPNTLRFLFRQLPNKVIVIIDEFDRVEDENVKRLVADTIKNFSDYSVDTTFIIVGIADSVDDLIAKHQSVERALVQVQLPRMAEAEIEEIIDKGLAALDMTIDSRAKEKIIVLSQGLPHYTHLLCFNVVRYCIDDDKTVINPADVEHAMETSIEMSQQSIKDAYFKAISSPRGNMYAQVLLACALANTDDMGYFTATDIKQPLKIITGKNYEIAAFSQHIKQFYSPERGPALKKTGYPRRYRYRFVNPLLSPFIVMDGLARKMISNKDVRRRIN
jgi:Cdc6-like AAA superfamily ATPase